MNSNPINNMIAGALAALLFATAPAAAVITPTINYQGYLISKISNLPVETPQDLKFYIYDTPTGVTSPLFSETRCNVKVTKGRYDVEIGSGITGGIPASIFAERDGLWLEIQVDGDNDCAGAFEAMSPRVKLQASPYSFSSVYATTSSVATSMFLADTIGAHPTTANGAITISTNLFVLGGISVGSISPGQTLAVAGMVESKGTLPACADDNSCGFKFPDGSVQTRAAALTMWEVAGPHVYSINPGNVAIGQNNINPQARLHISSAAGDAGDLLLVSTGTSQLFLVNGLGQVYGKSFYGDGTTLTGVLRRAGDTMTGQLTLAGSTLTVASADGLLSPKVKFAEGVEFSSAAVSQRGGIFISSHVYLMPGATFYGDGSGLINLISSDTSKVLKAGDTMTGQLTLAGSSLTVTGNAFSVGGSSLSVLGGNTAVGSAGYLARLTVGGGVIATSSITAQGSMHAASVHAPSGIGNFYNVTATTATVWGWDPGTTYSLDTASGVLVRAGVVNAPYFIGNGSLLTNVTGTDSTKLLKAGDTMTGNLTVSPSSVTLASYGAHKYALTVGSAAAVNAYSLAVTTAGFVGVNVLDPSVPLEVGREVRISHTSENNPFAYAKLSLKSYNDYSYIHWTNTALTATGGVNLGVLGYLGASRDLIYRAMGGDPGNGGQEVFRIKSDQNGNWLFGIGSSPSATDQPREKFHVMANLLVSSTTVSAVPILYVSTTAARVSVGTTTQTHLLTVNGGISAVSSVTAQGGFFGDGSGLTNLVTESLPGQIQISTITARTGGLHDAVVFSTSVYVQNKLAVGGLFTPQQSTLHLKGPMRVDNASGEDVTLQLFPATGGNTYIVWNEGATPNKGVLGMLAGQKDLVYRAGATTLGNGVQAFRIKDNGNFIMGPAPLGFVPNSRFHVVTDLTVSAEGSAPALFVSTATGYVGVGTGDPQAPLHADGYALFSSSASILGGGLSGTQSALEVIGSTLVVKANGNVGIGAASPQARLDVAGSAQFGAGATRSTFTAEGFWQPRAMTTAELQAAAPAAVGLVVRNSDPAVMDLCVSTGTAAGDWALVGSKGIGNCY